MATRTTPAGSSRAGGGRRQRGAVAARPAAVDWQVPALAARGLQRGTHRREAGGRRRHFAALIPVIGFARGLWNTGWLRRRGCPALLAAALRLVFALLQMLRASLTLLSVTFNVSGDLCVTTVNWERSLMSGPLALWPSVRFCPHRFVFPFTSQRILFAFLSFKVFLVWKKACGEKQLSPELLQLPTKKEREDVFPWNGHTWNKFCLDP